jgi:hypothetical protein
MELQVAEVPKAALSVDEFAEAFGFSRAFRLRVAEAEKDSQL